ncbi:MAG: NAD(P)-dependent glycerol-3-phosphate dehydrogenase [Deltaproteobacteria bacterium]|nr:NAD(P)-dependent glycerol-3-phosphate dehydrogenase [Deltaproteobacteria bacterium]
MSITILGAGSWGTALAKLLAEKGETVRLWAHEPQVVEGINHFHHNPLFLSEHALPPAIRATNDLREALAGTSVVVSVVPSRFVRSVWHHAAPFLGKRSVVVSCTKGFEQKTFYLMTQVIADCLPAHGARRVTCLSGPTFAHEVAAAQLTTAVVAGRDDAVVKKIQRLFRSPSFLVFTSRDPLGVQVGGAVKNVIAIAAGIGAGMGLGANARAAIITRGLYEMLKVGLVLGARPETFLGLSGIGDVVLTCTDVQSRNFMVGKTMGEGKSVDGALAGSTMIAEGIETAQSIASFAQRKGLKLPIITAVRDVLIGRRTPREALSHVTSLRLAQELQVFPRRA